MEELRLPTTLSHYRIVSKLGAGGMGEVYLAQDTRLDRKVALKILPAHVAGDRGRMSRFVQEARAASALNHPNILTIYEIDEADSVHFIAAEFIDGETLRERMRNAPLKLGDVLDITAQIASALSVAHAAGIIHRDIKPENIMLRQDGIAKVLDFGLAKLTERLIPDLIDTEAPTSFKTDPGALLGTAAYMSPEQARGRAVDIRTDIFSLGGLLYEMVAGRAPFAGETSSHVIVSILEHEPAPLARFTRDAPAELERIVRKCLTKERDERYQTARDLMIDLKNLRRDLDLQSELERFTTPHSIDAPRTQAGRAAPTKAIKEAALTAETGARQMSSAEYVVSEIKRHKIGAIVATALAVIAVAASILFVNYRSARALTEKDTILLTDFVNTTGDVVFDGTLKQALAVHLGQSPFLNLFADERVRETLRLMNRSPDERVTREVGREICQRQALKAMLTGSIASLGRNYVISLEAINAQTGDVLAREQSEAEGKEQVLRSLGEAATRLREKLGESLSSIQKFDAKLEQATTSSLEALKAYSVGTEQNVKAKYLEAISSFKHAVELDPNFALAYRGLAVNYGNTGQIGLAAEAARKAFELRERVSEREKVHIEYSYYQRETGELHKAIEVLEVCTQTYPRDETAHHNLGARYESIGQDEKAVEEYREALRLNPSRGIALSALSGMFIRLNRFEEARMIGEQAIAQKFDSANLHRNFYHIAFINGDTAAMQQQVDWASARPGEYAHLTWQAAAAAFAGQWQKSREFSDRAAELAEQRKLQEAAGDVLSSTAEWAAVLGQCQQIRADLARAAALPRTPLSFFRAGIALALCGDAAQALTLSDEAVKQYPKNTLVNEIYLPLVRAQIEIQRGNRTQAIHMLQAVSRYESVSFYYQNYLRGQAYLGEQKGAEAAREFQAILDHRGWNPLSPLYPLAHLGLARAAILQSDTAKARKSYQDFLALWKDADSDILILERAKREYEKLK
jgi:eukaryotic-like serine/threonine-protein kinase